MSKINSQEYWKKREEENLKHYIKNEAAYDKEIKKIYQSQLDAIQKEIDAFYGRYAKRENISLAEAKKKISNHDVKAFERKAAMYVKEKNFSKKANDELRLYNATMRINRLEMLKANLGLEMIAGHDELEKFMGNILKGRTVDELERQAGILGKTIQNNAKAAHSIVNASYHNATFSDRIWMYQDLMKADLSKLLQSGLIQGKNPRVLAKELERYYIGDNKKNGAKGAKYNAERLMITELARVQTDAQKLSFEKNGFTQYRFIKNSDCCSKCEDVANADIGYGKGIYLVKNMMPGENAAPLHCFCRCSVAAHEDSQEYEEWLEFIANGGTTEEYNILKKKKSLEKNGKSGTIRVGRSVGAAAKNYPVRMPGSRQHVKLAEGQKIEGTIFAGKGTNVEIRDRFDLEAIYNVPASEIQKVSGEGFVVINGKKTKVELHWYEAKGEKFDIKIKRFLK